MKNNKLQEIIMQELNIVLNEFNLKALIRSTFYKIFGPKIKPKNIKQISYTRPDTKKLDRRPGKGYEFITTKHPGLFYASKKDFENAFQEVLKKNALRVAKMKQGDSINLQLPSGGHIGVSLTKNEFAGTMAHGAGTGGKFRIHIHDEEFYKLMQRSTP